MSKHRWLVGVGALLIAWLGAPGDSSLVPSPLARVQAGDGKVKFELYEDAGKEHRWRLKAANGKIIATGGQGYTAKADAKSAIQRMMKDLDKLKFEVYEDKAKEFRWRLKAANGQVVAASSEGYVARADAEAAVTLIKNGVAKALLD